MCLVGHPLRTPGFVRFGVSVASVAMVPIPPSSPRLGGADAGSALCLPDLGGRVFSPFPSVRGQLYLSSSELCAIFGLVPFKVLPASVAAQ